MRLSTREEAIVKLIADGRSDKQIGADLQISVNTVRTHLDRIFRRHSLHNRAEAAAVWVKSVHHKEH